MSHTREVEFFDISESRSVLDEIEKDLTSTQMARLKRNIDRVELHGWQLDGTFFDSVAGSDLGLRELRLTLDRVEYRLLFSEEWGEPTPRFVVLSAYKEKRNSIPKAKIQSAETRLKEWRLRNPRPATRVKR